MSINSGAGTIRSCSSMDNLSVKDRKLFEDLTKQIDKLKTDLEAEKQKLRQVHRDKVLELKAKQEEFDKKLERALEIQARKRETDKQIDLKAVEEKIKKQKEREIKNIWRLKEDEIKRLKRQFGREKEECIKEAMESERQKSIEKVHEGEDILTAKITQLTTDIFALNEHNTKLEDQIKFLTQENHEKIELMRRMKKEHEAKVETLVKQYKSDAMRETARLKLAERRIQEKDQHLSLVEHKADMANLEKEAVSEELTRVKKSIKDTPPASYRPATPDLSDRTTPPSPSVYNPLQNRINDLQAHCKKVEEQVINLKQENAQLRKKLSKDGGDGSDIHTNKEVDEKIKKLRKRNTELVSLAKQLDERCKALKIENEQLQSASISEDDKSAQQALRRQFARQQAKDLAEHTKQLHAKDTELESLRQQLAKVKKAKAEAAAGNGGSAGHGEDESVSSTVVSTLMMENLRMEKLLMACYQKSQKAKDVPLDPIKGFQVAADHMTQLEKENKALHAQVKELTSASANTTGPMASDKTNKGDIVSQEQFTQLQEAKEESDRLAGDLEKQLAGVRKENEALRTEISSLKSQHDASMLELQGKCDQLKKCLDEQSADNVKQKELVEQLRAECSELKEKVPASSSLVVTVEDLEQFTKQVNELKEENNTLLQSIDDLSSQLSDTKKHYEEAQISIGGKEQLIETLREELERTKRENRLVAEELERTKSALAVAIQEKETMAENTQRKEMAKQEEEVQEKDTEIINEEKRSDVKLLEEEKDLTKSEQHKQEDSQLLEQKEQAVQEQMNQVTNEITKASVETTNPEKAMPTNKQVPNRSSNIPIGKKPATPKHMSYASPPKHMTPKSSANLQSEFQQAGYEIEDGYDSDENPNTFSELPRGDDVSTGSLDDSLKGSESFVSLDNYGSLKQRVGSAKERDRKYSQESDTQLKERKSLQDNEARLKEPQTVAAAMALSSQMHKEEVLQKPAASLATEISQASETGHPSNTIESLPLSTSNTEIDVTKDKGAGSSVEAIAAKESVVLTEEQRKPLSVIAIVDDDDISSESESSDNDDVVIIKASIKQSTAQDVALFVVKFDYEPLKMSPNPNPYHELTLTAGRYVYIYGDMDEDGFYKGHSADNKQVGLIPSNFVERVNEGDGTRRRHKLSTKRRMLQHIDEESENDPNSEKSTTGTVQELLPPPGNVQLVEQSIDPVTHSLKMIVKWDPVEAESSSDVIGYAVYVDDELYCSVNGVETCEAELHGLVPKKIFNITVRSCALDGRESHDQPLPLTAGGNLLVAPQKVKISMSLLSPALIVTWAYPVQAMEASYTPPTHFVVLIDELECCRVEAKHDISDEDTISMTVEVTQDDIVESGIELSVEQDHQLIVRSLAANQQSEDSEAILLTPDLVTRLLNSQMTAVVAATARKDNSLSPVDNSVVHVPPVAKPRGMYLSSPSGDISSTDENEDSSDDDDVEIFSPLNRSVRENHSLLPAGSSGGLTNGTVITSAGSQTRNIHDQVDGSINRPLGGTKYYRAIYNYNPMMMSPNEGLEEEELRFHEGDIIKALGDVDSDGFMEGEVAGKRGLVPSNMIEEITDVDKLQSLVIDNVNSSTSANHTKVLNGCMSRMVKARYNYNPGIDSPNENDADEELCFACGDIILVCGEVGDDGFFVGELNGKRGMVPSNFVEAISDDVSDKVDGKDIEVFAASEDDVHKASQIIKRAELTESAQKSVPEKKRNLVNKGKGLVNRVKKK